MNLPRDEFLSEEDLDLAKLDDVELSKVWMAWLRAAQATNDLDADLYTHGVFCGRHIRFNMSPDQDDTATG